VRYAANESAINAKDYGVIGAADAGGILCDHVQYGLDIRA
jgi:hypothetical protein